MVRNLRVGTEKDHVSPRRSPCPGCRVLLSRVTIKLDRPSSKHNYLSLFYAKPALTPLLWWLFCWPDYRTTGVRLPVWSEMWEGRLWCPSTHWVPDISVLVVKGARAWSRALRLVQNPIKPSGHYMYHQFNIQQFYVLPTQCIYVFCVDLRTNSDNFPIQH